MKAIKLEWEIDPDMVGIGLKHGYRADTPLGYIKTVSGYDIDKGPVTRYDIGQNKMFKLYFKATEEKVKAKGQEIFELTINKCLEEEK